jgi:hypothetical protein
MTKCKGRDAEAEAAAETTAEEVAWFKKHAHASTGSMARKLQVQRIAHLIGTISPEKPPEELDCDHLAAALALSAIGPRNELEGMLAVQMIAAHTAAMDGMKRSAYCVNDKDWRAREMRTATRLLQLYIRQVEAFAKLRNSDKFQNYGNLDTSNIPESIRNPSVSKTDTPRRSTQDKEKVGEQVPTSGH